MILTITANPAIDITYTLANLQVGDTHRVAPAQVRAGGKGINVARVLHEQGVRVRALAPIGGHSGEQFRRDLDYSGITHDLVAVGAPTRSTVAIVARETTNLNESGHELTGDEWPMLIDAVRTHLNEARVVTYSGSHPPATPTSIISETVEAVHEAGLPIIVDTSGEYLVAAADAGADVLKPNDAEAQAATGDSNPLAAGRQLATRSGGLVLVSFGADGIAAVRSDGPIIRAQGKRLQGNTTGAGDAAVAAAALYIRDHGLEGDVSQLLRHAVAWSGAAVLAPLAGSITEPNDLFADITLTEIYHARDYL